MIYDKTIAPPVYRRRSVKRELSLFRERQGALLCRGLHFREEGDALVCAEGAEEIAEVAPGTVLYAPEGHGGEPFFYSDGTLRSDSTSYPGFSAPPNAVICYRAESGDLFYALTDGELILLPAGMASVSVGEGGTCAAVHYERLFLAKGDVLSWKKPFAPSDGSESAQGGGHVQLPSAAGDILSIVPYREQLFLFRERGITRLRTSGDPFEFQATEIPFSCGKLIRGSVRLCGAQVLFCTESGVFSFDGSSVTRLSGCGFSEIGPADEMCSAAHDGKYYALATVWGEKCIWCVDPSQKRGYFLRRKADSLAGGRELLFTEEGKLFRPSGRELPLLGRRECVLETERSTLGLSAKNKYLDGIVLEGEGRFRVEARGMGFPHAVHGRAGERLRFPVPVRGTSFSLRLRTLSPDATLRAVLFDVREEAGTW